LDHSVKPKDFREREKESILENVVTGEMAEQGQKVLSYAFKEIRMHELSELSKMQGVETQEFRRQLEEHLIYLCTFGMDDPLRSGIKGSI